MFENQSIFQGSGLGVPTDRDQQKKAQKLFFAG